MKRLSILDNCKGELFIPDIMLRLSILDNYKGEIFIPDIMKRRLRRQVGDKEEGCLIWQGEG